MNPAANELTAPLGLGPVRVPRFGRATAVAANRVATCLAALAGAAFLAAAIYGDTHGGRPSVRTPIVAEAPAEPAKASRKVASQIASQDGPSAGADPSRRDAVTVETESGVSVVRPDGTSAPGSIVVRVPDAEPARANPDADPRLLEKGRSGALPRLGPGGLRPLDAYARPVGELPGGAKPVGRIAIVIGGLGISVTATEDAVSRLPAPVTLAFAPYGEDLPRLAGRARANGHEIMLQIPMEPFDYPDSDPGPHTLLSAAKPAENIDHLHWSMGRFTGYVGLMNYMGAKVTSDERALAPLLREAGQRGLGVLDDGSSSRSLVTAVAGATPAARADLVLDAVPRADMIDKALARLETIAASGRIATATASALPVTMDRIARWSEGLAARRILLVPVSAALTQAQASREVPSR
ncbi:divergent polysaccharide deacetylase family protein [uncultured Enterovirga sp.]|uniref:divergent polysaccharide deacetylase family protein n=1 Tax=uncultured Enterovirga sp. TaxID=2026352 RepID=UPI0035C95D1E